MFYVQANSEDKDWYPPQPVGGCMTDLEAFLALYSRLGVELQVVPDPSDASHQCVILGKSYDHLGRVAWDKWEGYFGFFSAVTFDKDGRFLRQGFWE